MLYTKFDIVYSFTRRRDIVVFALNTDAETVSHQLVELFWK